MWRLLHIHTWHVLHVHYFLQALHYLILISEVEEVEIFKIALEYWNTLAADLYRESPFSSNTSPLLIGKPHHNDVPARRQLYTQVLSRVNFCPDFIVVSDGYIDWSRGLHFVPKLHVLLKEEIWFDQVRRVMISRMAKPEEVLIVENEQGEVVREFLKDTDSINLYKNMRETLGKVLL